MTDRPDLPPTLLPELSHLWQSTLHWQPSAIQQQQFQQLYRAILAGNRHLNLTRITDPDEFWEKHLWDSLSGIQPFLQLQSPEVATENSSAEHQPVTQKVTQKVIDIGTGAGFPGVPVAIVQPTWRVTLLDSTRKKIAFLEQLVNSLQLTNVKTLVERVEQVGQDAHHRQQYDLALVRAVATAAVCAEYALPLLQLGGIAVLYRGQWSEAETIALEPVVQDLGGEITTIAALKTPLTQGDRHCVYLRKVAATPPEFPRAIGIPTQHPLG